MPIRPRLFLPDVPVYVIQEFNWGLSPISILFLTHLIQVIHWIIIWHMHTIVELPEYQKKASTLLSTEERSSIVNYLATHPMAGVLLKDAGGIRKLRWAAQGKGKSGGVRVIYYYHNQSIPLFMLTVFGKGEKANLSKCERNDLAKLTYFIKGNYGG